MSDAFAASGAFAFHSFSPKAFQKVTGADAMIDGIVTITDDRWKHQDTQTYQKATKTVPKEAQITHLQYYERLSKRWLVNDPIADDVAQLAHGITWAFSVHEPSGLNALAAACVHLTEHADYHLLLHPFLAQLTQDPWGTAEQLRACADGAVKMLAYGEARQLYYAALEQYGEDNLAGQAHTLKGLGDVSLAEHDLDAAHGYYYKGMVLYEVVDFRLGQANTLKLLGAVATRGKDYQTAKSWYEDAATLYAEMNFDAELAATYLDLAGILTLQDNLKAAEQQYQRALTLFGNIEFWVEQADVWLAIGNMHLQARQFDKAQSAYTQALPLYQQMGNRIGQANARRALGNMELAKQDYESAIIQFDHALTLYKDLDAYTNCASVYQLLIHLYIDAGRPDDAAKALLTSLPLLEKVDRLNAHEIEVAYQRIVAEHHLDLSKHQAIVPAWLLKQRPAVLESSLASETALQNALHAGEIWRTLDDLATPDRLGWIDKAIQASKSLHYERAWLLKERAGIPGVAVSETLHDAIAAYDTALTVVDSDEQYAIIQAERVQLLRDMAGMPNEHRGDLLFLALDGSSATLDRLSNDNPYYAQAQLTRGNLLRELAGLNGQDRGMWMYRALETYDAVLDLPDAPHSMTHCNRASLLVEIAHLPQEDLTDKLQSALQAAITAYEIANDDYQAQAYKMLKNIRYSILGDYNEHVFNEWWSNLTTSSQPTW